MSSDLDLCFPSFCSVCTGGDYPSLRTLHAVRGRRSREIRQMAGQDERGVNGIKWELICVLIQRIR